MVSQNQVVVTHILKYIILFVFSLLWVIGCNPTLRQKAFDLGLTKDSYRYGDLYRLSNLPDFKQLTKPCPKPSNLPKTNTGLYIIGDSFTEKARVDSLDFVAKDYLRTHWNEPLIIQLDTTKRNILVLQTVERHFREHFVDSVRVLKIGKPEKVVPQAEASFFSLAYWDKVLGESEEALTSFLFSGDVFLTLKEWKASLNLAWFNRHNDQVALSPDGKNILFCWDTDSSRITSSFKYFPDSELDSLIKGVNQTRQYYLSLGFDEVYLSIIPNKTSIVAPTMGPYNHLVERVQQHPSLQAPVLDIWPAFTQNSQQVYSLSDTHWTCFGQSIWVKKVNDVLR